MGFFEDGMSSKTKRLIFFGMLVVFLIYTAIVATSGTAEDKGQSSFTEECAEGKLLYQEHNCTACHQLYGLGGYMGPDLTNVISAPGKGPQYARAFIQGGTQRMPNFQFSEEEINALLAFLAYVDKSGTSPVLDFSINYDATISNHHDEK